MMYYKEPTRTGQIYARLGFHHCTVVENCKQPKNPFNSLSYTIYLIKILSEILKKVLKFHKVIFSRVLRTENYLGAHFFYLFPATLLY